MISPINVGTTFTFGKKSVRPALNVEPKKSNNIMYLIGYTVFEIYLACVSQRKVSVQHTQHSASSHRKQLFHAYSLPQPYTSLKKEKCPSNLLGFPI